MPVISLRYGHQNVLPFVRAQSAAYSCSVRRISRRHRHPHRQMFEGDLPNKALKIVQEWIDIHRDALLKMWETQNITPLPPIE